MTSYLVLGNYTDEGIRNIKDSPNRLAAVRQAVNDAGGRLIFFYLTMGQYDFASLVEVPNDEVAATLLLKVGGQGNVRTTTLKAFTEDEYQSIVDSL